MTTIYLKLKDSLANDIAQGKYQPGDILPSENDLIKTWSVSRITVRNAIKQLALEGLVYTLHGRGTFVSETKITNYLPSLTSLSQDVLKRGMVPKNRVLKLDRVFADNDVASRLHLTPGDPVIHFIRVTSADDEPIAIGYTFVALAAIAPNQDQICVEALESGSFYALLHKIGAHLIGGVQTISSAAANAFEAEHLHVSIGSPLIVSQRVAYSSNRVHVEFTRMMAKPDMIQWKVTLGPMSKDE